MNTLIGIYISDEVSEIAGGIVIYTVHEDGERVRNVIAPEMVNAYKVPVLNR
jgi:hypothetical protein